MRFASFLGLVSVLLLACVVVSPVSALSDSTLAGPQYISSAIVWALLVSLLLLYILYIGVGCIMSVERPVRMTAVPLQLSKEY